MKTLTLTPQGIVTNPNTLSQAPEGALSTGSNVVCQRPGILDSRRGLAQYGSSLTAATKLFSFSGTRLVYDDGKIKYDSAGTWSSGQTLAYPETNYRPKSCEANRNFYLTSGTGVQKLTSPSATLAQAGVPAALDIQAALSGASGFLSNGNQCTYAVVFGTRDANNNLLLGAPSAFVDLANSSGGTRDASLTFTVPSGLSTSFFYRLYRSVQGNPPLADLYLSKEVALASGDISSGTVTVVDSTPDAQLSTALYTNETQEGALEASAQPPYCLDIALFAGHVFYANTRQKHQALLKMLVNPAVNDTITIAGTVYTAKAATTVASGQFDQSGSIDSTCRALTYVINNYASNTSVYALYLGEGQLLLRRRDFTDSAFTTTASVPTNWNIQASSENLRAKNGVYCSKPGEPEAVPTKYFAGSADSEIWRILPLRDALYIFKKGDGVFKLSGTDRSNFVIEEFLPTIRIKGDENCTRFSDSALVACNQGIVVVNSSGFQLVSEAINDQILPSVTLPNINQASFMCAYDTERLLLLGLPTDDGETSPTFWHIYSGDTQQWTTWARTDLHAIILDEKIQSLKPTQAYQERKALTRLDYADEEYSVTITLASGTSVTVASAANLAVGMTLKQGDVEGLISAINGTVLTMDAEYGYANGAAIAYTPIRCEVEFIEQDGGDPTKMKHFMETCGIFEDAAFAEITYSWSSNQTSNYVSTEIRGRSNAPWGRFAWGRRVWGGRFSGKQAFRTYIPRQVARCLWIFPRIVLEQAFNSFSFSGFSINYNPMSERFRSR